MNCCDYNCNQGDNCPARVTKVKISYLDKEPILTDWREGLRRAAVFMLTGIVGLLWLAYLTVFLFRA